MIKRTLYFGNPAYLSLRQAQLLLRLPEVEVNQTLPDHFKKDAETLQGLRPKSTWFDLTSITLVHPLFAAGHIRVSAE